MTKDQLKQEIRTNIKPNLRQEIAGSTLQQVLLDTVDLIPLSGSSVGGGDLPSDVATRQWVRNQGYATENSLQQEVQTLNDRISQIVPPEIDLSGYTQKTVFEEFTGSVADTYATKRDLRLTSESISSSLGSYATKEYVSESVAHATIDTSSLATKSDLNQATSSLSQSIAEVAGNIPDVSNFATSQQVTGSVNALSSSVAQTYETKADFQTISGSFNTRINNVSSSIPNVSNFPTRTEVTASINAATSSLSSSLNQRINQVEQEIPSLTGYATEQWTKDNFVSGSTFTTISGSIDTRINNKLNTSTFNNYTSSINTMSSSLDSRINNKVDQTTFTNVSSSLDTRINGKADNYSVTYPALFTGAVNCDYDMNVVVVNNSSTLSPTLTLTNPVIGKVVHLVFITSSTFSSSWSLAVPTTLTVGNDSLPVYLNGARLTTGDTVTISSADATAEMSILITSISVNIITYQN